VKKIMMLCVGVCFLLVPLSLVIAANSSEPVCAKGDFVRDLNRCQAAPPDEFSCPVGMRLDPIADMCFEAPQCTNSYTYSAASGVCEQ